METSRKIWTCRYLSPCGELTLGSFGDRLCLCDWAGTKHPERVDRRLQRLLQARYAEGMTEITQEAARQLDEYFHAGRTSFTVPLLFAGTEFQQAAWNCLLGIPYGQTCSYIEQARLLGRPTAVRAVANANGANALSIFVPCHRVVGADRLLTGYAGGITSAAMDGLRISEAVATLYSPQDADKIKKYYLKNFRQTEETDDRK